MQRKIPYIFYFIDKYNIDELTNLEKNIDLIFRNYNKELKIDEIKSIHKFCKIDKRNLYLSNDISFWLDHHISKLQHFGQITFILIINEISI